MKRMFLRPRRRGSDLAALFLLLLATPNVLFGGEDWPQFRGPRGDGHSTAKRVPVEWGVDSNIAWKIELPGEGLSSPVLQGERLYVTYSREEAEGKLLLGACCLDARSGEILWKTDCFTHARNSIPAIHSKNSHASPTPVVEGDRLYIHFGHLGTACLATDGKVIWKNEELRYNPVHGSGASPILYRGRLIVSCDGGEAPYIVALDAQTGKIAWKTFRKQETNKTFSFATSHVATIHGRDELISPAANCVMSLNPLDGSEYWRLPYEGYSVIPRPIYANGLIYLSTGYDSPKLLAASPPSNGQEAKYAWQVDRGAPNTPSLLVIGERLYMVSDQGIATCVNAVTGKTVWQKRIGGNFSASPWYAEGRIYLLDETGTTTVIEPGDQYNEIRKNRLDDRTLASPAVTDGALYLRGATHLYKIVSP
jgi:outer membrane protein assembly factor BamB